MINKLVHIKNYGTFENFNIKNSDWDGSFKKINAIYAPNGTGKTSFSLIFRSLNNDDQLLWKKRIEKSAAYPNIKFINDNGKEVRYDGKWNNHIKEVETFDSFYLEDNIYIISYSNKPKEYNIFEMAIKDTIQELKEKSNNIQNEIKELDNKINDLKHMKQTIWKQKEEKKYKEELLKLKNIKKEKQKEIIDIEKELIDKTNAERKRYIKKVNKYLILFGTDMQLTEIKVVSNRKSEVHKMIYGIKIGEHEVNLEDREAPEANSLKYYFSDGDKNALALSFFLAKFDILPNIKDYIVVVDDPFTSFDIDRKRTTINELVKLAKKVKQFFLLTHDLYFKRDFLNSCDEECLDLKISKINNTSCFKLQNTHEDLLTGLSKDILVIRNFIENPNDEQIYLREVIRCIRPVIEGIIRIKYSSYINDHQWLGDFIGKIRTCDEKSSLYRLKSILEELTDINDYSKTYHHSNANSMETHISSKELKVYCKKTIDVLEKI